MGDTMKYITRDIQGVLIVSNEQKVLQRGLRQYLNDLCLQEFSTFEGRIKSVQQRFQLYTNIPVYINAMCLLVPTKSIRETDVVYFNYHRTIGIQKVEENCRILFDDDSTLLISTSYLKIRKQIQKAELLLAHNPR